MLHPLTLEAIDDHIVARYYAGSRKSWQEKPPTPWVARLWGTSKKYGYDREFLDGQKDYSQANRRGSRGVMVTWMLDTEGIYEVQELRVRKKPIRYFARYTGLTANGFAQITEHEVLRWLLESAVLELTCLLLRENASLGRSTDSLESVSALAAAKTALSCCTS